MELLKSKDEAEKEKIERDEHPGCVKRTFTVRDRLLIFQALNASVAQGGDAKTLARLMAARELLDQDGVDDYFAATDKAYALALNAWANEFTLFIKSGQQDPGPKPKQTDEEIIGHEGTYWVKATLDLHIQDTLKAAKFDGSNAKHALSLFAKYGIKVDE